MPPFRRRMIPAKSFKYRGPARGSVKARAAPLSKNLQRQVKSLLEGKRRDADDVSMNLVLVSPTTGTAEQWGSGCCTSISGMTSGGGFAPQATGIIRGVTDTALINTIHLKGTLHYKTTGLSQAQVDGIGPCRARAILVWFYKPLQEPTSTGLLPGVLEVLEEASVDSLYDTKTNNSKRFVILSDRSYALGKLANYAASSSPIDGNPLLIPFDYKVKVNKKQHYVDSAHDGALGGHHDSDTDAGSVSNGLPVLYLIMDPSKGDAATEVVTLNYRCQMRCNYTA